jgi:hypothetical protein
VERALIAPEVCRAVQRSAGRGIAPHSGAHHPSMVTLRQEPASCVESDRIPRAPSAGSGVGIPHRSCR